jgi:hypothetical protein
MARFDTTRGDKPRHDISSRGPAQVFAPRHATPRDPAQRDMTRHVRPSTNPTRFTRRCDPLPLRLPNSLHLISRPCATPHNTERHPTAQQPTARHRPRPTKLSSSRGPMSRPTRHGMTGYEMPRHRLTPHAQLMPPFHTTAHCCTPLHTPSRGRAGHGLAPISPDSRTLISPRGTILLPLH